MTPSHHLSVFLCVGTLVAPLLSACGDKCRYTSNVQKLVGVQLRLERDCGMATECALDEAVVYAPLDFSGSRCFRPGEMLRASLNGHPRSVENTGGKTRLGGGGELEIGVPRRQCTCRSSKLIPTTLVRKLDEDIELALDDGDTHRVAHWPAPDDFVRLEFLDGTPVHPGDRVKAFTSATSNGYLTAEIPAGEADASLGTLSLDQSIEAYEPGFLVWRIPQLPERAPGTHQVSVHWHGGHPGCTGLENCSLSADIRLTFGVVVE